MRMNTNIPMMGQPVNAMANFAQGIQAAGMANQIGDNNRLRDVFSTQGAGILAGDQGALDALATAAPAGGEMAVNIRQTQDAMAIEREKLAMTRQTAQIQMMELAQTMSAQELQQVYAVITNTMPRITALATQGNLEGFNEALEPFRQYVGPRAESIEEMHFTLARLSGISAAAGAVYSASGLGQNATPVQARSSVILEDGTTVQSTDQGVRVFHPSRGELTGEDASQAIMAAREQEVENQRRINEARIVGRNTGEAATGAAAAAAGARGEQSVQLAGEFWNDYQNTQSYISNIDAAIRAIDEGAQSGAIYNMLPRFDLAGASLQNAMQQMGLDQISAVTFGALSEGEMRLAMSAAVPQNLDAPQLREWLVRKRQAQQAAAEMLLDASQYFSRDGNLDGWIAQLRERNSGSEVQRPQGMPESAWSQIDPENRAVAADMWNNMTDEQRSEALR